MADSFRAFDNILSPTVQFALARLRHSAPFATKRILANSAWSGFGQHLTTRLIFALGPTLRLEQSAAKAVASSYGNAVRSTKITFSEIADAFPGALETVGQITADWSDAQRELLGRLSRDQRVLRANFLGNRKQFRVVAIRPGLSDSHDGGRTVTLIEFARNGRVIYKPRSSEAEALWYRALGWLDRNGIHAAFRVPQIVSRKNYSWMEFIQPRNCRSLGAVHLFYFRWGAQAALAQILAASDLHRENWIAAGSQPMLVDAELIGDAEAPVRSGRRSLDRQSLPGLLETGLLPLICGDRAGSYAAIAPLDASLAKDGPLYCWPRFKGVLQPPWKYARDLVGGFEAVAGIFAKRDLARKFFDEIICRGRIRSKQRVLFRASAHYLRILRESLGPPNMVSPGKRRRWLVQKCCGSSINRAIGLAEARALARCDLPRFTRRRTTPPISWKRFLARSAPLFGASQLLRCRVLLGSPPRQD